MSFQRPSPIGLLNHRLVIRDFDICGSAAIPDSMRLPVVRSIPAHTTGIRVQLSKRAFHPKWSMPRLSGGSAATAAEPITPEQPEQVLARPPIDAAMIHPCAAATPVSCPRKASRVSSARGTHRLRLEPASRLATAPQWRNPRAAERCRGPFRNSRRLKQKLSQTKWVFIEGRTL